MSTPCSPTRPALAFRIGITGARSLDEAQLPRLSDQLHDMLSTASQAMQDLASGDQPVTAAYYHADGAIPVPSLHLVSPLARGSDRLAARAALALGYTLHVPMPFPQAEYERDFDTAEDLAEFRGLLAQVGADWLELDGDRGPEMNRSYEAVGRYVVQHSDVVIAIWDGAPGGGRGGTADIVRYAAHAGVPVWWLHATEERAPVWIADIQDLRYPRAAAEQAATSLRAYLAALIPPPAPCQRQRHGIPGRLSQLGQGRRVSPEDEYFAEREQKRRWPWRAYAKLMRWASGFDPPWTPPRRPANTVARYWFDRYEPANARAADYAARYRSSYVWVFGLGTLALIFGALALLSSLLHSTADWQQEALHSLTPVFAGAELVALLLILTLVCLGMRWDWHEHSIEYRLLAELYRKQQALAPLGWALPITAVRGMTTADRPTPDRAGWVAWLFAAEQRAAPPPRGNLAQAAQGIPRSAVLEELITEQRSYHIDRWKMAESAGHTLALWGEVLFGSVFLCVVVKLVLADAFEAPGWAIVFGFLATVLPGISAGFVGVRAYAELQLIAEQSHHMVAELDRAHRRVERLDTTRPLVSQDLGAEAAAVATLMLQDLDGWARMFRVKLVEPG
jgi:hypothetical protein